MFGIVIAVGSGVIGLLASCLIYGCSAQGKKDFDVMFEEYWRL